MGSCVFFLKKKEYAIVLLRRNWSWDQSSLVLQHSDVGFDPKQRPHFTQKVCDLLLGLSLVFWREEILITIRNKIGSFSSLENLWEMKEDR